MKRNNLKMILIGFLLILCSQISLAKVGKVKLADDKHIPAELFFKQELKSDFTLSPDGKMLAFILHEGSAHNLIVQTVSDEKMSWITSDSVSNFPPINGFSKSPYYWMNNNQLVFCKDSLGNRRYKVFIADISKNVVKCLTDFANSNSSIITIHTGNENEILIACNKRDPRATDIYHLNVLSGILELTYQDEGGLKMYFADNEGKVRIARTQMGVMKFNADKNKFDLAIPTTLSEVFYPLDFSADNKSIYAYSNIGRERMALLEFDLEQMKEVRALCENPKYDIWSLEESNDAISETSQFIYSWEFKKPLYANYYSEKYELVFFDKETQKRFDAIRRILGDHEYKMISYSNDYNKILFRISSGGLKGAYYYFDYPAKKAELVWRLSNWLPEKNIAEVRNISFLTRDGLTMNGYLTVPSRLKLKGAPVIINAHGVPHLRDIPGYNDINQFYANLGYVVMQINYRGSKGYGNEFEKMGYKQWGLKMQDDIIDGVNWLIKEGIADKGRIAIYGYSSGGYNTLAGLTFTPDLFACGISVSGNVNLFPYYKSIPKNYQEIFGDPVKDSVQFVNTSPLFHAANLVSPLMIVNGARDRGNPINEVDDFVSQLKKNGTEVEYLRFENAGHNIMNDLKLKIEVFKTAEAFFEKHLEKGK